MQLSSAVSRGLCTSLFSLAAIPPTRSTSAMCRQSCCSPTKKNSSHRCLYILYYEMNDKKNFILWNELQKNVRGAKTIQEEELFFVWLYFFDLSCNSLSVSLVWNHFSCSKYFQKYTQYLKIPFNVRYNIQARFNPKNDMVSFCWVL